MISLKCQLLGNVSRQNVVNSSYEKQMFPISRLSGLFSVQCFSKPDLLPYRSASEKSPFGQFPFEMHFCWGAEDAVHMPYVFLFDFLCWWAKEQPTWFGGLAPKGVIATPPRTPNSVYCKGRVSLQWMSKCWWDVGVCGKACLWNSCLSTCARVYYCVLHACMKCALCMGAHVCVCQKETWWEFAVPLNFQDILGILHTHMIIDPAIFLLPHLLFQIFAPLILCCDSLLNAWLELCSCFLAFCAFFIVRRLFFSLYEAAYTHSRSGEEFIRVVPGEPF